MGRSKRLNSKEAKAVLHAHGKNEVSDLMYCQARSGRSALGAKPQGKLVRISRRPASSENNWLHGVLFMVIAVVVISWALGY